MMSVGSVLFLAALTFSTGVRVVSATSCEVIPVKLALGITTQLIFQEEPAVTLNADEKHFNIQATPQVPRSIAIIPQVSRQEIDEITKHSPSTSGARKGLEKSLNAHFKTNLFVFFKSQTQLMFELQFVEPKHSDYILKVNQVFDPECLL